MRSRTKKFIGLIAMLVWLVFYSILILGIAVQVLPGAGGFAEFTFYLVAGLAWTVPLFPLIAWMNRPAPGEN